MNTEFKNDLRSKIERHHALESKPGKILGGVLVIVVGAILLAHKLGVVFPDWFFSWQMFLIVLGLFLGLKRMFRSKGWFIPIIIGAFFLIDEYIITLSIGEYFWPILIIGIGLFMIIKSTRKKKEFFSTYKDVSNFGTVEVHPDNSLSTTSIFGGVKKNITSKNFKGGDITCVMGGAEIDFMQADIEGDAVLNITVVFGGVMLVVPSNWQIKSGQESTVIMGSVEDRRVMPLNTTSDSTKTLTIKSSTIFGGIEIKNY
ncbi:MAG: hypothetical protein J0M08_05565 [Bacteroidetes bacterium]|nr:hypothetical protein [Bacteroidota bacterium]